MTHSSQTAPDEKNTPEGWPAEAVARLTVDGERAVRLVMRVTGAPLAWVEVFTAEGSRILAGQGVEGERGRVDIAQIPRTDATVFESDAAPAALFSDGPPLAAWVMAKLHTPESVLVGVLVVADVQPRPWSQSELADIADVAAMLSRCIAAESERIRHDRLDALHHDLLNLINIGPMVIFRWAYSNEWHIDYASPNLLVQFGHDPQDIVSRRVTYRSMVHPDDVERVTQEVQDYREAGIDSFYQHYRLRHADGTYRRVDDHTLVIRDPAGAPQYYYGYIYDVTDRVQSEESLRRLNSLLQSIIDGDSAYIIRTDMEAKFTFVNERFKRLIRVAYPELGENLIGQNSMETIVPEDHALTLQTMERCIAAPGKPYQMVLRKRRPAGDFFHTLWEFTGVADASGSVVEIQGVGFDITELIQTQQILSEREERYRFIFENSLDYIALHAPDGRILYSNEVQISPAGYTSAEVAAMDADELSQLIHPEDLPRIQAEQMQHMADMQASALYTYRMVNKDGSAFWVENRVRYLYDVDGQLTGFITINRNIDDRVQAQEALRTNEVRYRILTRMMSDFVFEGGFDEQGALFIRWLEGDYEGVTGYPSETSAETWQDTITEHPDDHPRVYSDLRRTLAGEYTSTEFRILHAQGHYVWVRVARLPIIDLSTGNVTGFYGVVQDIDAERNEAALKAEQERLAANLRHEEALNETIRRVVSAVSHDIRTPLAVISTSKDILSRYYDRLSEERREAAFDTIDKQLEYVSKMLDDLGRIVKGTLIERQLQLSAVNLETLCEVTVSELQQTIGSQHVLLFEADWQQGPVMIDETLVHRILFNLLSNAIKFSPKGGRVTLRLAQQQRRIVLEVSDEGIGIPPEDQEKIFDTFYRAENARAIAGTGLGLSIVKDCVERHAGSITLVSQVGHGATFTVELPLLVEQAQRSSSMSD